MKRTNTLVSRFSTPAFIALLLLVLGLALVELMSPATPALPVLGLMLTAAAPLVFLVSTRLMPPQDRRHPVAVSASMGLGCAMIMVGVQRFGEDHQWLLGLALAALIAWMLYQRYYWRTSTQPGRRERD